jgi:hypothetical protein
MSRFLVERELRDGLNIPLDETWAQLCRNVIDGHTQDGVTWFRSYVTPIANTPLSFRSADARTQNLGTAGAGGAVSCCRRLSESPPAAGEKHTLHLHLRPKL